MKTRIAIVAATVVLFWLAAVVIAGPDHTPRGWPNSGISSPGNPLHGPRNYASPHEFKHD